MSGFSSIKAGKAMEKSPFFGKKGRLPPGVDARFLPRNSAYTHLAAFCPEMCRMGFVKGFSAFHGDGVIQIPTCRRCMAGCPPISDSMSADWAAWLMPAGFPRAAGTGHSRRSSVSGRNYFNLGCIKSPP